MKNDNFSNLSDAISEFNNALGNLATQIVITAYGCFQKIAVSINDAFYQYEKAQEKLNCNNWRKNHGLPMIRRVGKRKKRKKPQKKEF